MLVQTFFDHSLIIWLCQRLSCIDWYHKNLLNTIITHTHTCYTFFFIELLNCASVWWNFLSLRWIADMWANSWSDDRLAGRWPKNCPTSSMLLSTNTSFWYILIMPIEGSTGCWSQYVHVHAYICMHMRTRTHTHTTHMCIYTVNTHAHKHMHTHIYTHIPSAVRKRKTSPSLQNMSHTLQATSRGSVLVYSVNILRSNNHVITVAWCIIYTR